MWDAILGWTGLDQYDESNPVGQQFLDEYQEAYGRRPEYCVPVVNRDLATVLLHAFADAHPLSPRGVKEALERVKMLPAASGARGTRLSFGNWMRRGWVGAGYLVARQLEPEFGKCASGRALRGALSGGRAADQPARPRPAPAPTRPPRWSRGRAGRGRLGSPRVRRRPRPHLHRPQRPHGAVAARIANPAVTGRPAPGDARSSAGPTGSGGADRNDRRHGADRGGVRRPVATVPEAPDPARWPSAAPPSCGRTRS